MEVLGSCVRGAIVAPEGKKFCVADLSNIEGRMLVWLAREEWKLQAFRDFDAGIGHDLYKVAYGKAFAMNPADVDDGDQRQIGKVMELALGYQGGVGAFLTFAAAYGIDLEAMADKAWDGIPGEILQQARDFMEWMYGQHKSTDRLKVRFGLSEKAFIVCDSFKRLWREAHSNVAAWWKELEEAARRAILSPGVRVPARSVVFQRDKDWLRCRLPSGRYLCYPWPQVDEHGQVSYMGVNQFSRKWSRLKTYGGKLAENITQGAARDVLASSMPAIDAAGYEIVLTVHDEIIAEVVEGSSAELAAMMATVPSWAPGLPLAAAGYEATRYRKG
jgi:DNA polymerase